MRVKLIGTRAEVGGMYAIASIKEDYLGYVVFFMLFALRSCTECFDRCLGTAES